MSIILCFIVGISNASEKMDKGSILKEDSIVFSLSEAEKLKERILELEEKERKLNIYENLYDIEKEKFKSCSESIDLFAIKEQNYSDMLNDYSIVLKEKDKQLRVNKYENAGYFALGATFIIGSFYMTKSIISE